MALEFAAGNIRPIASECNNSSFFSGSFDFQIIIAANQSEESIMRIAEQAKPILIKFARNRKIIAYSDLAEMCGLSRNRGGGTHMFAALDEISCQEVSGGNGMLSAVVVNKWLGRPGPGFFDLARRLKLLHKHDRNSEREFWKCELRKVFGDKSEEE